MKVREGDFLETLDGLIFDVKGLVHPPDKTIGFIRYFPDEKGERKRNGKSYSKIYSLFERYKFLKEHSPKYLVFDKIFDEWLCEVPNNYIKIHYDPIKRLNELFCSENLDKLELSALEMAKIIKEEANIPWSSIGVSGSILVGLHTPKSDIDLIFYGSKNCRKVYSALKTLLSEKRSLLKTYDLKGLKNLFDFRSKDTLMSFEDFARVESRKLLQGKFMQTDYYIRFVKDWNEIEERYGDVRYKNVGYGKIEAMVVDDSESIFTPCTYKIENVKVVEGPKFKPIKEVASFRGRFCEQARNGEKIIVQGKIERVIKRDGTIYYRILVGNKPTDYIIPKIIT